MSWSIQGFETGPVATNSYLVIDEQTGDAVIIDAPPDSVEPLRDAVEQAGVVPGALILTHTHWDHTGNAADLRQLYPAMKIHVHPDDEYRLTEPMKHTVWALPFTIEPAEPDQRLNHGDTVTCGSITFDVLHTPGHTEGGICLYNAKEKVIFVGDTLFAGSVGRADLPGGSWEVLLNSIRTQLMALPDDVRVFAGHGPPTTIGAERAHNPFLNGEY